MENQQEIKGTSTTISQARAFVLQESLVIISAATLSTIFILIVIWDKRESSWSSASSALGIAALVLVISLGLASLTNRRWIAKAGYSQRIDALSSSLSDLLSASNFADSLFYENFSSLSKLRDGKQFPAAHLLESTSSGDLTKLIYDTQEQVKRIKQAEMNNIERYKFYLDTVKLLSDQVASQIHAKGQVKTDLDEVGSIIRTLKGHLDELQDENLDCNEATLSKVALAAESLYLAVNKVVKSTIDGFC